MAVYNAVVTSPLGSAERVSKNMAIFAGRINLTNYNSSLVEITAITKFFKTGGVATFTSGIMTVVCDEVTDQGYSVRWNPTSKAFQAFSAAPTISVDSNVAGGSALLFASGGGATALHATSAVGTIALASLLTVEVANDVNVGNFGFVAVGFA